MPDLRHVPPGRAGRVWLRRRLGAAERGANLLDRKLRALLDERESFRVRAERTQAEWYDRCERAEQWLLRAALLGGQRELRLAEPDRPAEVGITTGQVLGVRYPADARCELPEPAAHCPGTAALAEAQPAYREALVAAARHAAAAAAYRLIDAEATATRVRLHALTDRWVPRLREALHDREQRLEETERAEGVRLRMAARAGTGGRPS